MLEHVHKPLGHALIKGIKEIFSPLYGIKFDPQGGKVIKYKLFIYFNFVM